MSTLQLLTRQLDHCRKPDMLELLAVRRIIQNQPDRDTLARMIGLTK